MCSVWRYTAFHSTEHEENSRCLNEQDSTNNITFCGATAPIGQGLRIVEASESHPDTPHSVKLPRTSDQPPKQTLTTYNTQKRQTSTPPAGFEPAMSADKRSPNHALDRAGTGIGFNNDPVL